MAGIDVGGGGGGRRALVADLNTLPFIDLMMVTIAFLLITAVWAANARIAANTDLPAKSDCGEDCDPPSKSLHVHVGADRFSLVWKRGKTVLAETTLPRAHEDDAKRVRYPELARALQIEWSQSGDHRDPADPKVDQAVLHTDDALPFKEMIAVLDAIGSVHRDVRRAGGVETKAPAFRMVLAER